MSNYTGTFLKEQRTKQGLTQSELASKLGLKSAPAIEAFESGKTIPNSEYLFQLSKMFSIPIEEFTIRIELDKRKSQSKYLPVFSESSIIDFIDHYAKKNEQLSEQINLTHVFTALYQRHKLPYLHVDPSYPGDLIFKVPNNALADRGLNKGDNALVDVFDFDLKDETKEFMGLLRVNDKIEIHPVIPYEDNDQKLYFVGKSDAKINHLLNSKTTSVIIGKISGVIRLY